MALPRPFTPDTLRGPGDIATIDADGNVVGLTTFEQEELDDLLASACIIDITDAQLRALRHESNATGDDTVTAWCDLALCDFEPLRDGVTDDHAEVWAEFVRGSMEPAAARDLCCEHLQEMQAQRQRDMDGSV